MAIETELGCGEECIIIMCGGGGGGVGGYVCVHVISSDVEYELH